MKNKEISLKLNKSRQMINYVVRGERNCSYKSAKLFSEVLGGSIETWMDETRKTERESLFRLYARGAK